MSDPVAGGDGSPPPEWRAPDDARELDADLWEWRRERATTHGRGRSRRGWLPWRRYNTPAFVVAIVLLGVATAAVGLVVAAPIGLPTDSQARPLATPTATPGSVSGLLPEVTLQVGKRDRPARALRPAVLAVLPAPCQCGLALRDLAGEAGQYALPVVLITTADNPEIPDLLVAARAARTYPAVDSTAGLARAYAARGVTVLLVRADGVVTVVARQFGPGRRFGAAMGNLNA